MRRAVSKARDPDIALDELAGMLGGGPHALVLVFCSAAFELETLGRAIDRHFRGVLTVGCTTAGEITPEGYAEETITAVAFSPRVFTAAAARVAPVSGFELADAQEVVARLQSELRYAAPDRAVGPDDMFAFVLSDGLARREEAVTSMLAGALAGMPLFGGSAGDDMRFERTGVYLDGAFHRDGAAIVLIAADRPFKVFKTQHFVSTGQKMVVTEADPARRTVFEINASPAAEEYARIIGTSVDDLSPMLFATHPVVVRVGGQDYVRAIQKANPDGSLTFFCAIDQGIVLTLAEGGDLVEGLEALFSELRGEIGEPEIILGCDCVLRRLEAEQNQVKHEVSRLLRDNSVVGFCTYGEQYGAMHVSQTFTGVAIAARRRGDA
ncbi:nitric oxide-sensing protein NosP [Marinivivus vitaminiproducens]|nr:nitric oxide-sensing protein NosP [Geminicoccaceae bacterium SCSIO 64248]